MPLCFGKQNVTDYYIDENRPIFKYSDTFINQTGRSLEWLLIEVLVYVFFLLTLAMIMIVSRFTQVGIDNSKQFESEYMCKMANRICDSFDFKMKNKQLKDKSETYYVNQERKVDVNGLDIIVKINKEDFEDMFKKKFYQE